MPVPGLNPDRCAARNRLAARRDGINAAPVTFLRGAPAEDSATTWSRGTLPKDDAEALSRINAILPSGAPALTEEDIYIHYLEAANNSFVGDRYLFLGGSTLRNIAADAQNGFAFMNSHRTGGLSHPSELPFGRTFAGRYEQTTSGEERQTQRALVGFYMLRGANPNGNGGPSTDDLHRGIDSGTIFDVSVGLHGGTAICDVCGEDLNAIVEDNDSWYGYSYLCPHAPGTTHSMNDAEIAAQLEKGVPHGRCSYTLIDAHCGEVSAVYDGAVTGAGFQKALALAKSGALNSADAAQARSAYSALSGKGDVFTMPIDQVDLDEQVEPLFKRLFNRFTHNGTAPGTHAAPVAPEGTGVVLEPVTVIGTTPAPVPAAGELLSVEQHPVLAAALEAGITSADQFATLKSNADKYTQGKRDAASQAAALYFAGDTVALAQAQETVKTADLAMLETLTNTWNGAHDRRFGINASQGATRQTTGEEPSLSTPPAVEAATAKQAKEDENLAAINPANVYKSRADQGGASTTKG